MSFSSFYHLFSFLFHSFTSLIYFQAEELGRYFRNNMYPGQNHCFLSIEFVISLCLNLIEICLYEVFGWLFIFFLSLQGQSYCRLTYVHWVLFMIDFYTIAGEGTGLLRLHSTYRHDLKIYSSDEGRVQVWFQQDMLFSFLVCSPIFQTKFPIYLSLASLTSKLFTRYC